MPSTSIVVFHFLIKLTCESNIISVILLFTYIHHVYLITAVADYLFSHNHSPHIPILTNLSRLINIYTPCHTSPPFLFINNVTFIYRYFYHTVSSCNDAPLKKSHMYSEM